MAESSSGPAPARCEPLPVVRAAVVMVALAALCAGVFSLAGFDAAGAQDQPDAPTTSLVPETTSTLPTGGDLGNILPRPNTGREPETPGDPGGSLQVALFFALCFTIAGMGTFVWWRSRRARATRAAQGRDPVAVATTHGGDVRKPRPPGIVD